MGSGCLAKPQCTHLLLQRRRAGASSQVLVGVCREPPSDSLAFWEREYQPPFCSLGRVGSSQPLFLVSARHQFPPGGSASSSILEALARLPIVYDVVDTSIPGLHEGGEQTCLSAASYLAVCWWASGAVDSGLASGRMTWMPPPTFG